MWAYFETDTFILNPRIDHAACLDSSFNRVVSKFTVTSVSCWRLSQSSKLLPLKLTDIYATNGYEISRHRSLAKVI
jgi:hypothetical protein